MIRKNNKIVLERLRDVLGSNQEDNKVILTNETIDEINNRLVDYKPMLECLRNTCSAFLCETAGIPDCIHYISSVIINYLKKHIKNTFGEPFIKNKNFTVTIPNYIFDEDKIFFDSSNIKFEMALYNTSYPLKRTAQMESEYNHSNTRLEYINGKQKLVNAEFMFRISELEFEWEHEAETVIYHEFTHAFQDYKRLMNNKNYKSGKNYLYNNVMYVNSKIIIDDVLAHPEKYIIDGTNHDTIIIDCCDAVYIINKAEQAAFISQSYKEIDNYISKYGRKFKYEEAIASTEAYSNMHKLIQLLDKFKNMDGDGVSIIGQVMCSLKELNFTEDNSNNEYKMLIMQMEKTINNIYSKLIKVLGYYCSKYSVFGIHGKMNRLRKEIDKYK